MRDRTRKRPPQGTTNIVAESKSIDRKARRMALATGLIAGLRDKDLSDLEEALMDRNDAECKRLRAILKGRYGDEWAAISKILLISMGRWVSRRVTS